MAEGREDPEIYWFNPDPRAIIDISCWHVPRSLKKLLLKQPFIIRINTGFSEVMRECAKPRSDDGDSWINAELLASYIHLHELGYAHSIECWQDKTLVGGLYGVSRGGAFFGESMFSRVANASKIAYCYLLEILLRAGYGLLDTQFVNPHLLQFGVQEIPRARYLKCLDKSLIIAPNPSHHFVTLGGTITSEDPRGFTIMTDPLRSTQ